MDKLFYIHKWHPAQYCGTLDLGAGYNVLTKKFGYQANSNRMIFKVIERDDMS